jgi:hypothetical protein
MDAVKLASQFLTGKILTDFSHSRTAEAVDPSYAKQETDQFTQMFQDVAQAGGKVEQQLPAYPQWTVSKSVTGDVHNGELDMTRTDSKLGLVEVSKTKFSGDGIENVNMRSMAWGGEICDGNLNNDENGMAVTVTHLPASGAQGSLLGTFDEYNLVGESP